MKATIELSQWAIDDIKRLIDDATAKDGGAVPVVEKNTWPQWIGAARVHLETILESAPLKDR